MKLSLEFIARHLGFSAEQCVSRNGNRRYSRVLLGFDGQCQNDLETLYVVERIPANAPTGDARGYIVVGSNRHGDLGAASEALFANDGRSAAAMLNVATLMFEKLNRLELELCSCAGDPDGLQKACDLLFHALGNPVYFVDDSFKVLAIRGNQDAYETGYVWKHLIDDGYMPWNVIKELVSKNEITVMESAQPAVLVDVSSLNTPFVNLAIRGNGALAGFFFVTGLTKRLGADDVELVNALAPEITAVFRNSVDMALLRGQRHESFLRDLAHGNIQDRDIVRNRASLMGVDADADYVVCILDASDRHDLVRTEALRFLDSMPNCKSTVIDECIMAVCALPRKTSRESFAKRMRSLAKRVRCRAGLSERFTGIAELAAHYQQARLALAYGLSDDGDLVDFSDSYFRIVAGMLGESPDGKAAMINYDAIVLSQYDAARGTDYAATLLGYVLNDRNSVRTATELRIHRSTLTYRLAKIEEICDLDLGDRKRTLAAAFSLFLLGSESA